jgi:hypothetical protein
MSDYVVRISDPAGKAFEANVSLPWSTHDAIPSNPDSKWYMGGTGLIAVIIGRCSLYQDPSLFNDASASTGSYDGGFYTGSEDDSSGGSQDDSSGGSQDDSSGGSEDSTAQPVSLFTDSTLALCGPLTPYAAGIKLYKFYGQLSTYPSGTGILYPGWSVSGGLASGPLTWVITG